MFVLKKVLSALLYPLPVCLLLMLVGLVLLWRGRRQAWGRGLVTTGFVLLLLCSFKPLPNLAVRALEDDYEVFSPAQHPGVEVAWVVVLGGGITDDPALPPNGQLSAVSQARLIEALRILAFYPQARLLLSGGGFFSTIPEASALREVAALLGVDPARIQVEDRSVDTADQAVRVRRLVGEAPFVLVTSAVHLPRSMALFERQGMRPLPAPAQYLVRRQSRLRPGSFFPTSENLSKLTAAWHEYLGLLWARLRGEA